MSFPAVMLVICVAVLFSAFAVFFVSIGILVIRIFIKQFRMRKTSLSHIDIVENPDYKASLPRIRLAIIIFVGAFIVIAAAKPAQGLLQAWYSAIG